MVAVIFEVIIEADRMITYQQMPAQKTYVDA